MSNDIKIKNGLTINLKGAAQNIIKKAAHPKSVSLNPSNFHLITPKVVVKVGEEVQQGDVIFFSKNDNRIKFCSPIDGTIKDIMRGAKRKIIEIIINIGPENTQSQVISAKAPIFLPRVFAITAPRDHVNAPDNVKKIPRYWPSRLGAPVKIITPIKLIVKAIMFFIVGISFNKKNAINIPNGISDWIKRVAEAPSRIFNP